MKLRSRRRATELSGDFPNGTYDLLFVWHGMRRSKIALVQRPQKEEHRFRGEARIQSGRFGPRPESEARTEIEEGRLTPLKMKKRESNLPRKSVVSYEAILHEQASLRKVILSDGPERLSFRALRTIRANLWDLFARRNSSERARLAVPLREPQRCSGHFVLSSVRESRCCGSGPGDCDPAVRAAACPGPVRTADGRDGPWVLWAPRCLA